MNFLFVYGNLKHGFYNHVLLEDSEFCGNGYLSGYDMYLMGSFPAIAPGNGVVSGEIYKVDDLVLQRIDQLEGHPDWYTRELVNFPQFSEGVWVYVRNDICSDSGYPKIVFGNWE